MKKIPKSLTFSSKPETYALRKTTLQSLRNTAN